MIQVPEWYFWYALTTLGLGVIVSQIRLARDEYPRKRTHSPLEDAVHIALCMLLGGLWIYWKSQS